jgi:Asp/Glu/hydantoin racemase
MKTRIALIHAVTVAIDPVQEAFRRLWPEVWCTNLLDDALSPDRERDGVLTDAMTKRIGVLADYAADTGAAAILFTCSAFGAAIEQAAARMTIPVLTPNEAMFEAALARGDRVGMLATFAPSVEGMEAEFYEMAARQHRANASIRTVCVPPAMAALKTGNAAEHNRLLAEAAVALGDCDVVMLAHFSTSRAEAAVKAAIGDRVLTSPSAAVAKLRGHPSLNGHTEGLR